MPHSTPASPITLDALMKQLRTVPNVTLDQLRDVRIGQDDGSISLRVVLAAEASALKPRIEADVRAALAGLPGVGEIRISIDPAAPAPAPRSVSTLDGVAHIIAVSSGKGGVGKSTVAVNLASALAMSGLRVGLMDADVYGPNVPTMMGVTDSPKIIQDPVKGEVFVPPTAHGVKVMSMGFLIQGDQPAIWRGPMLHSVVSQFCHKVQWGELDYLVVDMPPGTGDVQLSLAQLVPITGAILVTTPQEVSMQDVRRAYHMFEKVRVPVMGIVENMSWFKCDGCDKKHALFGKDGGKVLARKFGTELLAQLPMQVGVREGGDEGTPIVIRDPQSEVARELMALAAKVVGQVAKNENVSVEIGQFN